MLRCISAAVIALILWPSIAKCDNLVLEMTTTAFLGPERQVFFRRVASIPLSPFGKRSITRVAA